MWSSKEEQRRHYLKHREEILAKAKAKAKTPESKVKLQQIYLANRDKLLNQSLKYYETHKEERLAYSLQYRRLHRVCGKGDNSHIYGVNKTPYPIDEKCTYCNRVSFKSLHWHHWSDAHPEDGLWVCPTCHASIERLFRNASDKDKFITDFKSQLINIISV